MKGDFHNFLALMAFKLEHFFFCLNRTSKLKVIEVAVITVCVYVCVWTENDKEEEKKIRSDM